MKNNFVEKATQIIFIYFKPFQKNEWKKFQAPKGVVTPRGRRSHTATVFQDSLYIYGGYQDLKGSTSELWAFHFGKFSIIVFYFADKTNCKKCL